VNVVHVLTRLLKAGSEENTLVSCRHQVAQGHDVTLVHGAEFDRDVRATAERAGVRVIELRTLVHPIAPRDDYRAWLELARLLRQLRADVVHTHQSKAGVIGRLAARRAHVPIVVHGVHILPFVHVSRAKAALYVAAERICAANTDAFVSVSPALRAAYLAHGIGRADRHFVAYSAMDVGRFQGARPATDWAELLGVAPAQPRPPTAVMLAAFEPRKRHLELVRALPAAFAGLRDWRVVFAGQGELEPAVRALVAELGLADRVRFAGFRADPEAVVALADACLLTSMREGLPRVLVQYVAAGKAVVASELPGLDEVVADGTSAVITPSDDVSAAAAAVARLLADPAERARLEAGARAIDVTRWSPAAMNARIDEVYRLCRARKGLAVAA
jgi:glycosyltransferase involved in cell wall biosynthesis